MDIEQKENVGRIFSRFFDDTVSSYRIVNTSRDEADFREAVMVQTDAGGQYVLKLADNDFTFPDKISMWQRTAEEYRKLGYYCPRIYSDRNGGFSRIRCAGHDCVAYAEDFAPYHPAAERASQAEDTAGEGKRLYDRYKAEVWRMTARIAAKRFDYTDYPSAYCLFETFCPSDETDEVLENALAWKAYAETLPEEFGEQVQRIWRLWADNRAALEAVYPLLPRSVFQADLNPTNILLNDEGDFVGVYDFNICGREVFLNYLMRENFGAFEAEIDMIREALQIAGEVYDFSESEKETALPLYRCLKPLWFNKLMGLKAQGIDRAAIRQFLDTTEHYLTADIDFKSYMG